MKIVLAGPTDVASLEDLAGQAPPISVHSFPLTAQLARAYVEAGHQVRVVVQSRDPLGAGIVYGTAELSVAVVPSRRALRSVPDWFRAEVAAIRDAIRDWKPDVVHAHWTYEYARGAIASGFPHVVTAHDVPSKLFGLMKPRYYWWPKLLQGFTVMRSARRMTAQSPYTLENWKRMGRKGPIGLVPNGVSQEVIDLGPAPRRESATPLLASVCSGFGERKNTKNLLQAMGIVRQSRPGVRLRMYGAGYGPDEEASIWAHAHGLAEGVDFVGRVEQMAMLRQLRDQVVALVHPSLEESFGMSIAEAMALGLPVVGGMHAGAVPWLLDEGRAGILCDVRSPSEIAQAIIQAVDASSLGQQGRERVIEQFSLVNVAHQYLDILCREVYP